MKNRTWIRFIKTYFSFIICSILIMIPTYVCYFSILRDNECNLSSVMINNGMNMLDSQIKSLVSISQTTHEDSRYRLISNNDSQIPVPSTVPLRQIQNDFTSLIGTQSLVSDSGILLGNGVFFTRYRNYFNTQLKFYDSFFTYGNLTEKNWKDLLYDNKGGGFLPAASVNSADYGSYDCITYVCAWPSNYPNSNSGIFYATIKTQDLLSQLVTEDIMKEGYVHLYDLKGNSLLDYKHNQPDKKYQTISFKGNNLMAEVGIPDSLISKRLAPIHKLLLFYLLVMILVSLILALFFAYRNFNPVRKLMGIVNHTQNVTIQHSGRLNEYDYIADAVTSLDRKVDTFARTIEVQKNIIRVHVFEKALSEGLHSRSLQNDFIKEFSDFPKLYQIASLNFTYQGNEVLETLVSLYDEIFRQLSDKVYKQASGDSSIIMVLPLEEGSPEDFWVEPLEKLQSLLIDKYDMDFRISLSERFGDYRRLPEAYSQIRSIDMLSDRENSAAVCQLKDFPKNFPNYALDFSSMQQLYDALNLGDFEAARSILDSNLKSIHLTGYVDEVIIKQVFYNFRNILLRVKLENYENMNSVEIPVYEQSASVRNMFGGLSKCCSEICTVSRKVRETSKARFSESVCEFILENITNEELYAKMVANHFGISETTLQKIIHASVGKTFFEYVEDLRLEKAYQLLKTTSFTINHIACECGFSSQNSFYKAFKRRYHQSPGSIR